MFAHRLLRPTLFLCLAAALLLAGPLTRTAQAVDLKSAWSDLEQLKKSTKSAKSTNEDLLQYLDAAFNGFKSPDEPPKPADDASDEEKAAYEKAKANFDKDLEKYRKASEKAVLKLLTLVKVQSNTNSNIRDDVNIRAAGVLGDMSEFLDEKGRKDLTKKVIKAIESKLVKVKTHDVNTELLEAAFAALGKLNHEDGVKWMLKEWSHANEVQKAYLIAGHKALVLFKDVPGKLRYEICDRFTTVYASVESQAEQSSTDAKILAKKRFWDDIKTHTIPVLQHFAGKPTNADGVALSTMQEFQGYMRDHKNAKRAPWVDEKVDNK